MTEYPPELVERCMLVVRRLDAVTYFIDHSGSVMPIFEEARAIVAELPEPVDPDLIEAQKLCDLSDYDLSSVPYEQIRKLNKSIEQLALSAIKRGRELERSK